MMPTLHFQQNMWDAHLHPPNKRQNATRTNGASVKCNAYNKCNICLTKPRTSHQNINKHNMELIQKITMVTDTDTVENTCAPGKNRHQQLSRRCPIQLYKTKIVLSNAKQIVSCSIPKQTLSNTKADLVLLNTKQICSSSMPNRFCLVNVQLAWHVYP